MTTLSAKTRYILMAAWSILAASSCTNDYEPEASPIIAFQPTVQTRAVKESFTINDAFTVWGGYDNDATNVFNGETVTNNGGNNWNYTGTRYWVSGKTYDFYAIYPTGYRTCSTDGTLTVSDFDTSDNKGEDAIDLMTAEALGRNGSNPAPVPFTFRHELARVQVVAQCETGVSATLHKARLYGISTSGTLTRNGNNATWQLSGSSSSFTDNNVSLATDPYTLFGGDLLLIPQSLSGLKLDIDITRTSGSQITQTLDLSESGPSKWEAGQTYRYTILIKQDVIAITFSNFIVPEWGETQTGGDINIGGNTQNGGN